MKHLPFFFLVFCVGFSAHAQVPSYVPNDGLVGWWPMNASAIDIGPNNLSSQTNGALGSPDRFGTSDGALFFDGLDDYVEVSSNSALDVQGELSISAWFVMDGGTGPGAPPRLVEIRGAYGGGGNAGYVLRTYGNSQTSRSFEARCYSNSGNSNLGVAQTSEVPALEWHHITFTASQSSGISRFYVDGQLIDETVTSDSFDPFDYNNNNLFIGAEPNLAGKWGGSIDDLGIWNRALSAEEVSNVFNGEELPQVPTYVPSEGLVAWWGMDGNGDDFHTGTHTATNLTATPAEDRFGSENSALFFGGNEEMRGPGGGAMDAGLSNAITLSCWLKTSQFAQNQGTAIFRHASPSVYYNWAFHLSSLGDDNNSNRPYFLAGQSLFENNGGNISDFTLELNTWHHVVLRVVDGLVDMHVDGVEVFSNQTSSSFETTSNAEFVFGSTNNNAANDNFIGLMDDVGVWSRGISDAEILALYGAQYPITGCTDDEACNFDEASTLEDGSCEYGCNYCGPGTTWDAEMQMCLPEIECDSLYNPDVDFDGFIGLQDLMAILSHYNNEWPPWECGDPLEYQGYDYETVQIGEQCWFAENLRAENYRNGDAIIQVNEASTWQSLSEGGRRIYGLGDMNCGVGGDTIGLCSQSSAEVLNFGGYLYNWYVVAEGAHVCPNGWHAPDNDAFDALLEHAENLSSGLSGLKSTEGWVEGSEGSNQTGFHALGSGYGGNLGNFSSDGHFTGLWSTNSSSGTNAHHLQIDERPNSATTGGVFINDNNKKYALSIRCIKDTEQ